MIKGKENGLYSFVSFCSSWSAAKLCVTSLLRITSQLCCNVPGWKHFWPIFVTILSHSVGVRSSIPAIFHISHECVCVHMQRHHQPLKPVFKYECMVTLCYARISVLDTVLGRKPSHSRK